MSERPIPSDVPNGSIVVARLKAMQQVAADAMITAVAIPKAEAIAFALEQFESTDRETGDIHIEEDTAKVIRLMLALSGPAERMTNTGSGDQAPMGALYFAAATVILEACTPEKPELKNAEVE
jgi:hypothetical protein